MNPNIPVNILDFYSRHRDALKYIGLYVSYATLLMLNKITEIV